MSEFGIGLGKGLGVFRLEAKETIDVYLAGTQSGNSRSIVVGGGNQRQFVHIGHLSPVEGIRIPVGRILLQGGTHPVDVIDGDPGTCAQAILPFGRIDALGLMQFRGGKTDTVQGHEKPLGRIGFRILDPKLSDS